MIQARHGWGLVSAQGDARFAKRTSSSCSKQLFKEGHKHKLVTVLAIGVANLNNTPGSVAVYFDLAVSVDRDHSMSIAFDSIQRTLSSRRVPCVMFTQSANVCPAHVPSLPVGAASA